MLYNAVSACLASKNLGQTPELHQTMLKDVFESASQGLKAGKAPVLTKGSLLPKGCITRPDSIYPMAYENSVAAHTTEDKLAPLE